MPSIQVILVLMLLMHLLLLPVTAAARSITIATEFRVFETPAGTGVEVTVRNRGKAAAHDVQVMVELAGEVLTGTATAELQPGAQAATRFLTVTGLQQPGRNPLVIRTYYRDAAGKRYTALIIGLIGEVPEGAPALVISGGTALVPGSGSGQLAFELENTGDEAIVADVGLYLPDELSVSQAPGRVELAPGDRQTLIYTIANYSALEGSRYPVTLLAQYPYKDANIGVTGTGRVRIGREPGAQVQPLWVWILIGLVLPVISVWSCRRRRDATVS